jgi:hypothetical protein
MPFGKVEKMAEGPILSAYTEYGRASSLACVHTNSVFIMNWQISPLNCNNNVKNYDDFSKV